jgi:hypothetical protein
MLGQRRKSEPRHESCLSLSFPASIYARVCYLSERSTITKRKLDGQGKTDCAQTANR